MRGLRSLAEHEVRDLVGQTAISRAELLGIEAHYYPNRKLLKCVNIETVQKFLTETCGN